TGFTKIERLDSKQLQNKTGYRVSPDMTVYHLYTLRTPAGEESVREVRNRLRGKNARLFPWIAPIPAILTDESGKEIRKLTLQCLSADEETAEETGLSPVPEWSEDSGEDLLKIMLPSGISVKGKGFFLKLENNGEILSFPVSPVAGRNESEDITLIPAKLGGILRLFQQRNIRYDENLKEFILFRQGYAGFRMYAKSIFDVDHLRKFFEKQSLLVYTEIVAINRIINLNKGMGLIFFLMAALGISGCAASLTASLYASVERKKREMSVLRLIGLSGFTLFRFPVYQGILIGSGGFIVSLLLFQIFSALIHEWFRPYVEKLLGFALEEGISFCRLPFFYITGAFLATVAIAALAAVIAAFRITRIEPAEALRDE
ncbi:MAG: ABC transporter permease, partial [Desulfococcaceae bacterium]|nr:ABC transporter permease [Desulfococcaceae bacterium]